MDKQAEQQIPAVHRSLDAFELRVLARQARTADLTTIQDELSILQADVDSILDIRILRQRVLSMS